MNSAARRPLSRRELLRRLGLGSAVLPFVGNLPSLAAAEGPPKKRLVIVFSPDGVVRKNFWPQAGPLAEAGAGQSAALPQILEPLAPFRDRLLTVKGVHNKVKGDGDWHLRGIGCLLTGVELFQELAHQREEVSHAPPVLEPGVFEHNDRMPQISRMQIELLVAALSADFTRVATLQYTQALGNARFTWLGIDKDQHNLSHEPETNAVAQEQLTRINAWYAAEIAHLARRLTETPEPGGDGSMLDHTTIVWTNELGDGNHSLEDIPWVCVGNGLGFSLGRAIEAGGVPHNRLLLSLAHAMGLTDLDRFGNPDFCGDGPLTGLA